MGPSRGALGDLLQSAGGVLLGIGAVVLLTRKSGANGWSEFAQLLVALVPAVVLYGFALGEGTRRVRRRAEPAQSVLAVSAILLWPLALVEFLRWIGASTSHALNLAAVFALTGVLAFYVALRARAVYAVLLGALAMLVAWLLVWSRILDHPSADTFRWLLLAGGIVLLAGAAAAAGAGALGAGELAIAGGIALVAAGVFGVLVGSAVGAVHAIAPVGGASVLGAGRGRLPHVSGVQHLGWDIYLLIASVALLSLGSRVRVRGLGYVGGAGILAFLYSVGVQITRLEAGRPRSHDVVAWPLVLLAIGTVALVTSLATRRVE
jgi:hypothetical protein